VLAERAVTAQLERVRADGLLPLENPMESPELVAARDRLEELLDGVRKADPTLAFGAPCTLVADDAAAVEALRRGVRERAALLRGFETLPDVLWDTDGEPRDPVTTLMGPRRASDSLAVLRSAANLLSATAWLQARSADGGAEAGRWLARALALARVTEGNEVVDAGVRTCVETIALTTLESIRAEGTVDAAALEAPVRAELDRPTDPERWRRALRCDLARLEWIHEARTWERFAVARTTWLGEEIRWRRELCEAGLDARPSVPMEVDWLVGCLATRDEVRARVLGNG
jgi:hypothetical protein